MRQVIPLLAGLLVAGCAGSPTVAVPTPAPTTPTPSVTTQAPTPSPTPLWVVGASPLPIASDGFGKRLPTPRVLRDRHLPTADLLPPPRDGRFHATVTAITPAVRKRMGETHRPGCPVPLSSLRHLTLTFHGFDGKAHTGELVVAAKVAPAVVRAFRSLYDQRFPIEEMRLPTTADLTAKPTGDGNNTAAYVCRAARGQTKFSAHAYGVAVDVNPFHNPLVRGDLVLPELASAYRDRAWKRDGMLLAGSPAVRAFTREGWTWGGTFSRPKDYMHFSQSGD